MKECIVVDLENAYVKSVIKAFNQFMIEEVTGQCIAADIRLSGKLEAARLLFKEEREALRKGVVRFGKWDCSNVCLTFKGEE